MKQKNHKQNKIILNPRLLKYFQYDKKYKEALCKLCRRVFELKNKSEIKDIERHLKFKHKIVLNEAEMISLWKKSQGASGEHKGESENTKKRSIFKQYSAKGFEYQWLSYFKEEISSDEECIPDTYARQGQKQYYHGTQYTDSLKYTKYKRYSKAKKEQIQQACNKLWEKPSFQQQQVLNNEQRDPVNIVPLQILANIRFEIFQPNSIKSRRSFCQMQKYQEIMLMSHQKMWIQLHENYREHIPKKNKLNSIFVNFPADPLFQNLRNYGYSIYVVHDIKNRFFGFSSHLMKIKIQTYGENIYMLTECSKELNFCLFFCQDEFSRPNLVGICFYEHHEAAISKKIFQFLIKIARDVMPSRIIYMDHKSGFHSQNFEIFLKKGDLNTEFFKMNESQNQQGDTHKFRGLLLIQEIQNWQVVKYLKWGLQKIRHYEISIESVLLILPQIEIISQIQQIRCRKQMPTEQKSKKRTVDTTKEASDKDFSKISSKIQNLVAIEHKKASEKCFFEDISPGFVKIWETSKKKHQKFRVGYPLYYKIIEERWICRCGLIEKTGIPCCHLLRVLTVYGGAWEYYINSRWLI